MMEEKYNFDILFLGGVFDNEEEIKKNSIRNTQFAANVLQFNIINAINDLNEKPIKIVNSLFIGTFPKNYKKIFIPSYEWLYNKVINKNISFINILGFSHLTKSVNLKKELLNWAKDNKKPKVIIVYSVHSPFLYAIRELKRKYPDTIICLIAPDLPLYMDLSRKKKTLYRLMKKIDNKLIMNLLNNVDCFVLLTKYMNKEINMKDKPITIVEGMVNINEINNERFLALNEKEIKIFYSGTLNYMYGIKTLLEAFSLISFENYRLIICGEGEADKEIIERSKKDCRINYLGRIDRDKVLKLQQESTVLINPRNSLEQYTKFSFPSKNMEYLSSGRPLIAYKLAGIPNEYDKHIQYIEGISAKNMAQKITEVCSKPQEELINMGLKAREFVIKEKNTLSQSKKILDLVSKTYQNKKLKVR